MELRPGLEHLENIPKWDEYFLKMIPLIRSRSKDKHTKVGCVIVSEDHNVLSTGYNSLPAGVNDFISERYERPMKYNWMAHSEENAISSAAKNGIKLKGSTIYMMGWPCVNCARMIIGAGIREIVYSIPESNKWNSQKYDANMEKISKMMLYEAGIIYRGVDVEL